MSLSLLARNLGVICCLLVAGRQAALAQPSPSYSTNGGQYAVTWALPGDQVQPQLLLGASGGFIAWEDNITDGDGKGISALRLDPNFSPSLATFRVNQSGAGDQERVRLARLNNGGTVFVWQGGRRSYQHIYARFMSSSNTWLTGEILVNTFTNNFQIDPVVATLANGNVVVAWSSYNQAGVNSMRDIYGQVLSPAGQKVGPEFAINQFSSFNQRNPSLAALTDGRFVVAWISEQQRVNESSLGTNAATFSVSSVDVFARVYTPAGTPAGQEFLVNTASTVCSSPAVAASADGGFTAVWVERDRVRNDNGWDIYARRYSSAGAGGAAFCVNNNRFGDQYQPQVAATEVGGLITWTSLGHDGAEHGVFGRFLAADGSLSGNEFQVNTTWVSRQMDPAVAADGQGRFLVAWTSFVGGASSFDLYAQRYVNVEQPLPPMDAPLTHVPFIVNNGVYQPQIHVIWPAQPGLSIDRYEVYVDGAVTPAATLTTNVWVMTAANGLAANSTHTFKVMYVTTSQRRSPLSAAATARTWSGANNWGGIPSEWMTQHYGTDMFSWPRPDTVLETGGPTLLQVFLSGANPKDPATWLRTTLTASPQGYFLSWNSKAGITYQVQRSADLKAWTDFGSPRYSAGLVDAVNVGGSNAGYYRVVRVR